MNGFILKRYKVYIILFTMLTFVFIWQMAQGENMALVVSQKISEQIWQNEKAIELNLVNILQGRTKGDYLDAKQQISEITLLNLNLHNWSTDPSLNCITVFGDVYPTEGDELVVALSLGKDKGILAIYEKTLSGYKLISANTNLIPITNLSLVQLKGMPYKSLVVDEFLDEMLGAFYKVKLRSIYAFKGNLLAKLWSSEIYREEYFPEGFEMKGEKTQWLLKKEETKIAFLPSGDLQVSTKTSWGRGKVLGKLGSEYIITSTKEVNKIYVWDRKTL